MKRWLKIASILVILLNTSCLEQASNEEDVSTVSVAELTYDSMHLLHDYPAITEDGLVNVIVEIPTGSVVEWNYNEELGVQMVAENDGIKKSIEYLGYPGNYGFVPQTLTSEKLGGDGNPFDIIVLGPPITSEVVVCKVIAMMELLDRGQQDDMLIAVTANTVFYEIDGLEELNAKFGGVSDILTTWFENYKGRGAIEVIAIRDRDIAEEILNLSIQAYQEDRNGVIEDNN